MIQVQCSRTVTIFINILHRDIPQLVEKHLFTLHMRSLSFWLLYLRLTSFTRARRLFLAFHEVGVRGRCFGHWPPDFTPMKLHERS